MRKSGWAAAAAGLGSLVLLLTACGGSSSSSSAAGNSGSTPTAGGQPTTALSQITPGTTVLIVQRSELGFVLAEASGLVVYTYAGDHKGGSPTCTGSCASVWSAVTGIPLAGPADYLPGKLGTVTAANGAKQITYNGYPLYTYKDAGPISTKGNDIDGMWHVIKLSASDVKTSS